MLVAVGDETDSRTNTKFLVVEKRGRLQDIDVVVRTGYSKVCMSNPQPVVSYRLKDNRGMLALETGWHIVNASQNSRKPMLSPVHIHQILAVLGGRLLKNT